MKFITIKKIAIVVFLFLVITPLFVVEAKSTEDSEYIIDPEYVTGYFGDVRSPSETEEMTNLKDYYRRLQTESYVESYLDYDLDPNKIKTRLKKEDIKDRQEKTAQLVALLPELESIYKDATDGDTDFGYVQLFKTSFKTVGSIASFFGPTGMIVGGVLQGLATATEVVVGGSQPTEPLAQFEERMNEQFLEVNTKLDSLEMSIKNVSSEINSSTDKIINSVTTELDDIKSKELLREFMKRGKGGFSYSKYRNYIFGELENNDFASTAYYAKIKNAEEEGMSEEYIKMLYDKLYIAIMNDRDYFYEYVVYADENDSIIRAYYDVVSKNPSLCGEDTPEIATIKFMDDLYQLELNQAQMINACNFFQVKYMLEHELDEYVLDGTANEKIYLQDILENSITDEINLRLEKFENKLACELVYVLGINRSYLVKEGNNQFYEVLESDDAFGKLIPGQTIYLNNISSYFCEYFSLNKNDFRFEYSNNDDNYDYDYFNVSGYPNIINVNFYYKDQLLTNLSFEVANEWDVMVGDGSIESPYLIRSVNHFLNINNEMDSHYKLIKNIDFKGKAISPLGTHYDVNEYVIDEFTGYFDGNGFAIENLTVKGKGVTGIFAIIGSKGEVTNLKLYDVNVNGNVSQADKTYSEFFGGILAGKNNGTIKYCVITGSGKKHNVDYADLNVLADNEKDLKEGSLEVYNSSIIFKVDNSKTNKIINLYVGGIAGRNSKLINACKIENTSVLGSSKHYFGGDKTTDNKNSVFVGGVCGSTVGYIKHTYVDKTADIGSYASSLYSPQDTVNPYVSSYAAGITADLYENNESLIDDVLSNPTFVINSYGIKLVDSRAGRFRKNCHYDKTEYVFKLSESKIDKLKSKVNLSELISTSNRDYEVEYQLIDKNNDGIVNDFNFNIGNDYFNYRDLDIIVDGVSVDYTFLGVYGFNTNVGDSKDKNISEILDSSKKEIIMIFSFIKDNENIILSKNLNISVKDQVNDISILGLKEYYKPGEFSFNNLSIKYEFTSGVIKIDELNQEEVLNLIYEGNINDYGEQLISFIKNEIKHEFVIKIMCDCSQTNDYKSIYKLDSDNSQAPSCTKSGYNLYYCPTCNNKKFEDLPKKAHDEIIIGDVEPTCYSFGKTGTTICKECQVVLKENEDIFMKEHNYIVIDDYRHGCGDENCNIYYNKENHNNLYSNTEEHNFEIYETVKLIEDDYGIEKYYLVLIKKCKYCSFYDEIIEDNEYLEENKNLATVNVSNSYALNGNQEVVVYVQLINNNFTIRGASFGIRYSDKLQLVKIEDGNLFVNWGLKDGVKVGNGYNFCCIDGPSFSGDGNLLKLVFKTPEDAKIDDKYFVSIVYNNGVTKDGKLVEGGFSVENAEKQLFITQTGYISIVDHLPGDVNNDGIVDITDAIEIGKFMIKSDISQLEEIYANVNLSVAKTGYSPIDIDDAIAILKFITGEYTNNVAHKVQSQKFEIFLNYNGYIDKSTNNVINAALYKEDKNSLGQYEYNLYSDLNIDTLVRPGYRFIGWSDKLVGGNIIDLNPNSGTVVKFNHSQFKQTLYAQWEKNELVIFKNDSTNKDLIDEYEVSYGNINDYDESIISSIENLYYKELEVLFNSDKFANNKFKINFSQLIWKLEPDGHDYFENIEFNSLVEVFNVLKTPKFENVGKVKLTPIWSNPYIDLEYLKLNYSNNIYGDVEWQTKDGIKINDFDAQAIIDQCYDSNHNMYIVNVVSIEKVYEVVFNFNGGSANIFPSGTIKVTYSHPKALKESDTIDITRDHYSFVKWYYSDEYSFENIKNVNLEDIIREVGSDDGKIVLTAIWLGDIVSVNFVDRKLNDKVTTVELRLGEPYYHNTTKSIFENPEYKHLYVEGAETILTKESIINDWKTHNVYIVYNNYSITFDYNANSSSDLNGNNFSSYMPAINNDVSKLTVNHGEKYRLPIPTSQYYIFDGWYYNGKKVEIDSSGLTLETWEDEINVKFVARWIKEKEGYKYIKTASDLSNIGKNDKCFLISNIENIGNTYINTFAGVFDGNNLTISGGTYSFDNNSNAQNRGLFRSNSGKIMNLILDNITISSDPNHDGDGCWYGGALAGYNSGEINNVKVYNSNVEAHRYISAVGGITGVSHGLITNCYVENTIVSSNGDTGGITGGIISSTIQHSTVNNCIIKAYIVQVNRGYGGIAGSGTDATIYNCHVNTAKFVYNGSGLIDKMSLNPFVGTIIGWATRVKVESVGTDKQITKDGFDTLDSSATTGALWWTDTHNQKQYLFTGPWSEFGAGIWGYQSESTAK